MAMNTILQVTHRSGSRRAAAYRLTWLALLIALMAQIGACGGGGSAEPSAAVDGSGTGAGAVATDPSPEASAPGAGAIPGDQEIADRIYQGRDRTPPGFYQESVLPITGSYTTTHIKNTMIAPIGPAAADARAYELCTDDWSEALAWSEEVAARMPAYAPLTETNANDRFYEFVRERPGPEQWLERQRVFRCSYLDRSTADLRILDGPGGTLNGPVRTAAVVKELAEYLWQFTVYNNYGNAVLASSGVVTGESVEHTLTLATLVRASTAEACDRIEIVRWVHAVQGATGVIARRLEAVRTIHARDSGSFAILCPV
ncbi:MAG: hypothetical protein AB7G76_13590 [Steroidobacteraceae bacterium]